MISQFIKGVAKGSFPTTIPLEPTYASLKVHLIDKSCISCHGEVPAEDTDLQLNTYERARDKRKAVRSLRRMKLPSEHEQAMPPADASRISVEIIDTFEQWIELGFPE